MSKANEKRAAEILYALGYGPDEVSGILDDVTHALDEAERRGERRVLRLVRSRDHGCNCGGNPGCTCDCHIREAMRARRGKR